MLNLSGTFKYYLCTDQVTLRYRHRGLREYIRSKLHRDPTNGDVYIFLSRDFTRGMIRKDKTEHFEEEKEPDEDVFLGENN